MTSIAIIGAFIGKGGIIDLIRKQNKLKKLAKLIENDTDDPNVYCDATELLIEEGKYTAALYPIEKLFKKHPNNFRGLKLKASLFTIHEKKDEAIALYKTIIALKPEAESYFLIGLNYHRNGQLEDALAALNLAIKLDKKFDGHKY